MFIADSQVHIWAPDSPERRWNPDGAKRVVLMGHRVEPLGLDELRARMHEAGVSRAIIVPPSWEGDRIDLGLEAARTYPDKFAVMARIPLSRPDEARALLGEWRSEPGIKGTRLTFHRPQDIAWLTDGTADWYWPLAERMGIPTMVHAPTLKRELGEVARAHPKLKMIVDHMGVLGHERDDAIGPWIAETTKLAALPNVYVKVSALPGYSTWPYPYKNLNQYVRCIVEAFGPQRCFWGTDLSRMLGRCALTYSQVVDHALHHLDFLSQADLEWVMGRALCACLDWPIGAPATAAPTETAVQGA
jgi:predicted TIM-barrel fold metal-dependent hydrolase